MNSISLIPSIRSGECHYKLSLKKRYTLRKDVKWVGWDARWLFVMQKVMFKIIIIKNYFDKPTQYPYGTYVIADYNCNS